MDHRFQVNLRGIIDLLSNHLYSRPEVFVRELLQNAVDAITARRALDPGCPGEIHLTVVTRGGGPPMLEARDDGVGLTEAELHSLLATIGQSSKRDDQGRRTGDFLGQFGIGLLSCFVVSDEIVVVTRSARGGSPAVEWRAKVDGTYSVRSLDADVAPGTQVYLTCRPGREDYFTAEAVADAASRYGALLPHPIRVTGGKASRVVNRDGAPWRVEHADETERARALLRFGAETFDERFLDAIPLRSRAGSVDGVAFVLAHPANLNARRGHRVYLRNMLLSEAADDLLPDWAFFARAVVNADDLRPTASREGFYEDDSLRAARAELGDCLRDALVDMARRHGDRFRRFLEIHHLAIKALAAQDDECFRLFVDWLPFETTRGRLTARELCEAEPVIRYVDDVSTYHQLAKVATSQGITLVNAGYVYEPELLARLPEVRPDVATRRVEPEDVAREFDELDLAEQEGFHALLDAATEALRPFRCRPEARKFRPADMPALYQAGTDARFIRSLEQSRETADPLFQGVLESLATGRGPTPHTTLLLNASNPMIRRLATIRDRQALARAVEVLYVQGLMLAHQPLSSGELGLLSRGLAGLLDLLAERQEPPS
ncbi:HSP90 family protein [Paludisphaera sp.]|uniref:HSP90 family protein n=1 Tax=Paludisphaera sp. TaxID=2017432 RepID=UPI00301C4690